MSASALMRAKLCAAGFMCLVLAACSDTAMTKYVLFSPMFAIVYLDGVPVSDARVERTYRWTWGEKSGTDETTTDKQGRFSLAQINGTSSTAWLPHEPSVLQNIFVYVAGKKYDVWGCRKIDYDLNRELNGKPLNLRIELNSAIVKYGGAAGRFTIE